MPWTTGKAGDGYTYDIYMQEKNMSCSAACVAMVARLVLNKKIDESKVHQWIAEEEGMTRREMDGSRDFDGTGVKQSILGGVFKHLNIKSFPVKGRDNVAKWIGSTSKSHPAVVGLEWTKRIASTGAWVLAGGGHMVVAAGVHGANLIILDPLAGVVEVPTNVLPRYRASYPGHAQPLFAVMERMQTT